MASKRNKSTPAADDLVATLLLACRTVDEFVAATAGVVPEAEVRERFAKASNVGQFRMVIGNRMRGEIARARAKMSMGRPRRARRDG